MGQTVLPVRQKIYRTWPLLPSASACTSGRRTSSQNDLLLKDKETTMKQIATVALMLNLGVAVVYAQQAPIRMTCSGNGAPSTIDLKHPNSSTVEENVAGTGTLGPFTFRDLRAAANSPQPSSTCTGVFFPSVAGGGILRVQDGSLLKVNLTGGGDCIDFVHGVAHCTLTFQIAGGTGR